MHVRYVPGPGVLVARLGRYVLVHADASSALTGRLWQDLASSGRAPARATLRELAPGRAAVLWEDGAEPEALGGGTARREGDRMLLAVADAGPVAAAYLLVEGVVPAASAEVAATTRPGTPGAPGLIDGIPPEILAGGGPLDTDETPTADPAPQAPPEQSDHTVRVQRSAPAAVPAHLQQATSDTVLAVRCPAGHLSDALAASCRRCGREVPPQEPRRVLRPVLGHLVLPDGDRVPLDRPVVLGRRPAGDGPGDWPHLVHLPQDSTYLSRRHLRIDLDGWYVLARDLGSAGGTTLEVPGRDPEKIRAHEDHLLEDGTVVDLAGAYRVTFVVAGGDGG